MDETKKGNDSPQQLSKQPTKTVSEEKQIDPAIMELGKSLYDKPGSCTNCHQPTGAGLPGVFPPLAGSEWVNGPAENMIRIHLRGLQGPITVKGVEYGQAVSMAPVPEVIFPSTNENVAAVLTYVRNSWGNTGSEVTPEMVAKYQGEKGQPPLTAADLIDPNTPVEPKIEQPILVAVPNTGLGSNIWATSGFLIVAGLCAMAVLRMKAVNK